MTIGENHSGEVAAELEAESDAEVAAPAAGPESSVPDAPAGLTMLGSTEAGACDGDGCALPSL
ncbi:hypothetical protein LWF01_17980 [Saxibacter everestensis]|uniref:Uncharacterized protein n=1 Tax=Saxibacter everestensis TaxID=2909229 RepID=A0ABY8QUH8_9MICO|nr:hypothetical protein LWF01_17980 [Brevibacteriaceae bacterium ZFBP1038]